MNHNESGLPTWTVTVTEFIAETSGLVGCDETSGTLKPSDISSHPRRCQTSIIRPLTFVNVFEVAVASMGTETLIRLGYVLIRWAG